MTPMYRECMKTAQTRVLLSLHRRIRHSGSLTSHSQVDLARVDVGAKVRCELEDGYWRGLRDGSKHGTHNRSHCKTLARLALLSLCLEETFTFTARGGESRLPIPNAESEAGHVFSNRTAAVEGSKGKEPIG